MNLQWLYSWNLLVWMVSILFLLNLTNAKEIEEEKYSQIDEKNIQMPTKCEGCLILSREIETAISKLNTKIAKEDAEIWLIEQMESICEEMLHFKIHKEKSGIHRFSPDSSKTMKTLKNLRKKGVKVELGMPEDLWEAPSVETEMLQRYCELIIEEYENDIESWFWKRFKHQTKNTLAVSLCHTRFAKELDHTCLPDADIVNDDDVSVKDELNHAEL